MEISGKKESLKEINDLLNVFCRKYLNDELTGYVMKLYDKLGRQRTLPITRGSKEIWASAIVYVIARLNFLFDRENENFLSTDTICTFFNTRKKTVISKATQIQKICRLGLGTEGYCSKEISDSLTLVQLPNGFVVTKNDLLSGKIIIEFVEGEDEEELNQFMDEQRRIKEREIEEKKARRTEINRKIAEEKRKKKQDDQLGLFEDS